jgi:exoribonuclease R
MARADALGGQIGRAVIDLAEAVMLQGRAGEAFDAIVTDVDDRGARIQLRDLPIVARVAALDVAPGDALCVRLTAADLDRRMVTFQRVS